MSSPSWDITDYLTDTNIFPENIYSYTNDSGYFYGGFDTQCVGICVAYFEGFGFDYECTAAEPSDRYSVTPDLATASTQSSIDASLAALHNTTISNSTSTNATTLDASTYEQIENTPLRQNPLLVVEAEFVPPNTKLDTIFDSFPLPKAVQGKSFDYGSIGLNIKYTNINTTDGVDSSTCTGRTMSRFCTLRPAVVQYPLVITNISATDSGTASVSKSENGIRVTYNRTVDYTLPE